MAPHRAVHRRAIGPVVLLLVALPLLGGLALGAPGVDGGDLVAQRRVDGPVPLQAVLPREVRRYDERGEGLAAAACWTPRNMWVSYWTGGWDGWVGTAGGRRGEYGGFWEGKGWDGRDGALRMEIEGLW